MNTTTQTVNASAIVVRLTSGVDVRVCTLTPITIQRLVLEGERLHPLPDKTTYEKPMPNALPGSNAMIPAEKNPDYITALSEVIQARARHLLDATLDIVVLGGLDEDETVEAYAPQVAKLRKHNALVTEDGDSDFMIVLRNFLLHDMRDVNKILEVAQMHAPLSAPEVADGRALFRVDTERATRRTSPLRTVAPRLERAAKGQPEPTLNGDANSA